MNFIYFLEGTPIKVGDGLWTTTGEISLGIVEAILEPGSDEAKSWSCVEGGIVFRYGESNFEVWPRLFFEEAWFSRNKPII